MIRSCRINVCGLWRLVGLIAVELLLLSIVGVTRVLVILCKAVLMVVKMEV